MSEPIRLIWFISLPYAAWLLIRFQGLFLSPPKRRRAPLANELSILVAVKTSNPMRQSPQGTSSG